MNLIQMIVKRISVDGAFIVSVECPDIPPGADNIEFLTKDKHCNLMNVEGKDNQQYVMVFTSKERFELCSDTSGVVMFIDDLLRYVEQSNQVDGIGINLNKEQLLWNKMCIRMVLSMLDKR